MLLFAKLHKAFSGYFDPEMYFEIMKITNVRGDLTDGRLKQNNLTTPYGGAPRPVLPFSKFISFLLLDTLIRKRLF